MTEKQRLRYPEDLRAMITLYTRKQTTENNTAMVKAAVNLDKDTVMKVIKDLHTALQEYGIKDNHIALFGSFLEGNTHEDSDMDIIIISQFFEDKNLFERIDMTAKAQVDVQRRYVVPMDILLKTPKEYEYSKKAYYNSKIIV